MASKTRPITGALTVAAAAVCAAGIPACARDLTPPPAGALAALSTLVPPHSLSSHRIAAAQLGPDGALYVLDIQGAVVRVRSAGEDTVTLPGTLSQPVAMAWSGDTLLVLDAKRQAVVFLQPGATPVAAARVLGLHARFASGLIDVPHRRAYVSPFGRAYYLDQARASLRDSALAVAVSLSDGRRLHAVGAPRRYPGTHLEIAANHVLMASRPQGGISYAWPLESVVASVDSGGTPGPTRRYELPFKPPEPRQWETQTAPVHVRLDYQQLTYGIASEASGTQYLLMAVAPKTVALDDPRYTPPAQALEVRAPSGEPMCRVALPVFATGVVALGSGSILLYDGERSGAIYRADVTCGAPTPRVASRGPKPRP